jgi:enoyl-CoA hydratase
MDYKFETLGIEVDVDRQLMTVSLLPHSANRKGSPGRHWELGELFSQLRGDNSIRVIVVQGTGGVFQVPPKSDDSPSIFTEEHAAWSTFTGVVRCHEAMADLEKPIIAKVNGDAIGFGSSLAFACDLIVAVKTARFADHHLSMGELEGVERSWGVVPGDGGIALAPLVMSPYRAKEYLMLGRPYTADDLERIGVINYAVDESELDALVSRLAEMLLKRGAYSLAWTKRLAGRVAAQEMRMVLDASAAYELVDFYQIFHRGSGQNPRL